MKIKPNRKTELRQKGWTEQDIQRAETILERSEKEDVFFSHMVFWSALIVIIIGNFIASLLLIPFLVVFNAAILYSLTIILGATIGFLYNFLIMDVEHLERRHHRLATFLIPTIALVNIVLVVIVSNKLISESNLKSETHSPLVTALVFVIALLLPYTIDLLRQYHQESSKATIVK